MSNKKNELIREDECKYAFTKNELETLLIGYKAYCNENGNYEQSDYDLINKLKEYCNSNKNKEGSKTMDKNREFFYNEIKSMTEHARLTSEEIEMLVDRALEAWEPGKYEDMVDCAIETIENAQRE